MEIKKILEELREKKARARDIQEISSEQKLWSVVKDELAAVSDKYGGKDRRRTKLGSAEDEVDFDPEAYIVRENTNVVLTRDGWIKRVGRLSSVETTRTREGDEVQAVLPGNTTSHVVFFADDGSSLHPARMVDVPGPAAATAIRLPKFFRLADQVKIIGAITCDECFTPADWRKRPPCAEVVTSQGQVLRTPLSAYRSGFDQSRAPRCFRRAEEDKVVTVTLVTDEPSLMLALGSLAVSCISRWKATPKVIGAGYVEMDAKGAAGVSRSA
jgi:DNA gyrase subunit A